MSIVVRLLAPDKFIDVNFAQLVTSKRVNPGKSFMVIDYISG